MGAHRSLGFLQITESRLGWVVYVWIRLSAVRPLAHTCPAAGLDAGFVLKGGAVGAQGALMLSHQVGLGLVRTLARTRPPPTVSLCLSLSPLVSECHAQNPQIPAWTQTGPWNQLWSPLRRLTHSAKGRACLCSPYSQSTALTPYPVGYEETLTRLAAILAKHFADTRIVGTGEVPYRGLGGVGTGWHLWLAIFCMKCWPDGHEARGQGLC